MGSATDAEPRVKPPRHSVCETGGMLLLKWSLLTRLTFRFLAILQLNFFLRNWGCVSAPRINAKPPPVTGAWWSSSIDDCVLLLLFHWRTMGRCRSDRFPPFRQAVKCLLGRSGRLRLTRCGPKTNGAQRHGVGPVVLAGADGLQTSWPPLPLPLSAYCTA